ncbi:MAG: pyridoxamine 5'-phosphate oxidase family protein, partial [Boseongicola sp. SB0673_bin_14]|nr:pyridoxamine 5'-phosphate oxidase family protein [Boseongicola sp. SB0673_bin_14]
IGAERVLHLATPPYDDGVTEDEMIALYKSRFAELYP